MSGSKDWLHYDYVEWNASTPLFNFENEPGVLRGGMLGGGEILTRTNTITVWFGKRIAYRRTNEKIDGAVVWESAISDR